MDWGTLLKLTLQLSIPEIIISVLNQLPESDINIDSRSEGKKE